MAQPALYKRLDSYNQSIANDYKDKWGTLLQFLSSDGNDPLKQMSEKVSKHHQESQKNLISQSIRSIMSPVVSSGGFRLKSQHHRQRYQTVSQTEGRETLDIAPAPENNLYDRFVAGEYNF